MVTLPKRRSRPAPPPPSAVVEDLKTQLRARELDVRALSTANLELGTALAALRVSEERFKLELADVKRELAELRGGKAP